MYILTLNTMILSILTRKEWFSHWWEIDHRLVFVSSTHSTLQTNLNFANSKAGIVHYELSGLNDLISNWDPFSVLYL